MSKSIYKPVVLILIALLLIQPALAAIPHTRTTFVVANAANTSQPECVRIDLAEEISSLNPLVGNSLVDWFVFNLIYDKLAIYSVNLTPEPWLAYNWTVSPNHKTWIIHLVKNATWQDGVPFTAQDVVFTINYIKQHKEIWLWQAEVGYIQSVKALNNYTVEINTTIPTANLPWFVFPRLPILPKHIWENITNPTKYLNLHPVGNGPFILKEYKPGEYMLFVANPHYWRKGEPHVSCILAKIGLTSDTAFLELKKGDLDIMVLPPEYVKQAEQDPQLKVVITPDIYFDYIVLNTKVYPLNITLFRKALAYAIDKQDLVNRVLLGYGKPLYSVIPPAYKIWHNPNVPKYEYNPQKANEILDELGFKRGSNGIRLLPNGKPLQLQILTLSTWPPYVRMADLLKKYLQNVGIELKIVPVDWGDESQRLHNRNYQIAIWGYTVAPDPSEFLKLFTSWANPYWSMGEWSNKTYDKLYSEQLSEFNLTKRKEIIWKMQDMLAEQLPIIPIWVDDVIEAYRVNTFTGWIPMPMGILGIYNKLTWLSVHPVSTTSTMSTTSTTSTTSSSTTTSTTSSTVSSTMSTSPSSTSSITSSSSPTSSSKPTSKTGIYVAAIIIIIIIIAAIYYALRR